MIKSMTGFGHSEIVNEDYKVTVELKSVNHKYSDITIKMPRKLNQFEVTIRNLLKDYIKRGKVDVYITYEDLAASNVTVKYNKDIAASYLNGLKQINEDFGLNVECPATVLSRYPEVFTLEETASDDSLIYGRVEEALKKAAATFVNTRIEEGSNLKRDILAKLDIIEKDVEFIVERSPQVVNEYRSKLKAKVEQLLDNTTVDESVLATEITVYADKMCVDEEMVRLRSHITAMRAALDEEGSIGRKLDFIAQELNREANTTLSKSSDISISNTAIELKTEIEKIREQIQNIE